MVVDAFLDGCGVMSAGYGGDGWRVEEYRFTAFFDTHRYSITTSGDDRNNGDNERCTRVT